MDGQGKAGHDLLRQAGKWGLDKPRLRVQQAAGLRTKASNKELEQRECPAFPCPSIGSFYFCIMLHSLGHEMEER